MSKSIVIVHGGDLAEPCGGTNRVFTFANHLLNEGYDIHLIVPEFGNDHLIGQGAVDDRFTIHMLPVKAKLTPGNRFRRAFLLSVKAKKIAEKYHATLQVEHSNLGGVASLLGCENFILDMHDLCFANPINSDMYLSRIVKRFVYLMEQRSVKAASKIIVVSEPMKQFLISEWNISPNKIEIIPNGFHKSQVERLNVTTTAQVEGLVCFMGIMHPYIDLRKIIEIGKKLEHAQVEIIGDGLLSKNLRYLISRHQLNNISISGFLPYEEALSHVCRAQVAIAPYIDSLSLRVSCPVKLYDYGALGKAIVADDATEIGRRFHASRAAIVSDPSETDRFVQNVDLLLDDKQMRNELGKNARNLVQHYTWEKQGEKLLELYAKI